MNQPNQSTQQPDDVPPTLCDGQPRACLGEACKHYGRCNHVPGDDCFESSQWCIDDYLTTLARTALITDNEDLRQLACVLVQWSNRRAANRIARCALELGELSPPPPRPIHTVENQEQLDHLLGKGFCGMPKESTE